MPVPSRTRARWIACALLVAATCAVYVQVLDFEFVAHDDPTYVTQNRHVLSGLRLESVAWAFTESLQGNWHPLTWLSHMLDVELFGLEPGAHHATGLALHVANTLILFLLLETLTGATKRSAFVAGVFALHPLHVESVAWVSERKDVLSTCFGLLSMAAWVRWVRARSRAAWATSLVLFALALMSKAMLVTLPFLLLLLDLWPLGRVRDIRPGTLGPLVWEKLPYFGLALASSLVTLETQAPGITRDLALSDRVANVLVSYASYLGKAVWPVDLAAFYPRRSWSHAQVLGAGLLVGGLSAGCLWRARTRPYLAVGWLWFLGMLVPVIGLVQVGLQSVADRYTYVPLVGLAIAAAWGVRAAADRLPHRDAVLGTAAVLVLASCGLLAHAQAAHWRDHLSLFQHALVVTDDNYYAHTAVGIALTARGDHAQARRHLDEALRIAPQHAWSVAALAHLDLLDGETDAAIAGFERASALTPDLINANFERGQALERAGRTEEAIEAYRRELEVLPEHLNAARRFVLLAALHRDPDVRESETALAVATRLCELTRRERAGDLDLRAGALAANGRFEEAEREATLALDLARANGEGELARAIEHRLRRYRARQPLRLD